MSNLEKYNLLFVTNFNVPPNQLETLVYHSHPQWDSIGHMVLIAAIEDKFSISFHPDDIMEFNSYVKGKEILNKYNIDFNA